MPPTNRSPNNFLQMLLTALPGSARWILGLYLAFVGQAQAQIRLQGQVLESKNGTALPGATVYAPGYKEGVSADAEGRFEIGLPGDTATVRFGFVGYRPKLMRYGRSQRGLTIVLEPEHLQEVVIDAEGTPQTKVQRTQMSVERLETRQAKLLPALFGEVDLLRILQLKPGVQSGGEGTTGLYVRGGGADQNLFLLDEAVIYNPSHLFGFLSVFNPDAVRNIDLYKGGFPANYGGRLSSVVDVRLREGNRDSMVATGGIGLISSRFTLEGPIQKGKSSYIFSARRTYFDVATRAYNERQAPRNINNPRYSPIPDYYFYDMNGRLTFDLSERDRLYISGYLGRDVFGFQRRQFRFNFDWGNSLLSARLVHRHDARTTSEASVTLTDYRYNIRNAFDRFSFSLSSGIQDITGRLQISRKTLNNHQLVAGVTYTNHAFTVGRAQGGTTDNSFRFSAGQSLQAGEYAAYASDQFNLTPRTELIAGVRLSGTTQAGTSYGGIEPRLIGRFTVSDKMAIKASYGRMYQYLHLVSPSATSIPTDLWYPSGPRVRPQVSDQVAAGYNLSLGGNKFFFSHELYYKKLANQVDFKDGANLFLNQQLDTTFIFGRGWAYGTELYLEKRIGRTTGWIGYTLAWTWRQFSEVDNGQPFHPRYDRRHDLSIVVSHQLNHRWSLSGTFVYGTGNAVTLPVGRAFVQDIGGSVGSPPGFAVVPLYGRRNSFRMAPYHRADVSAVWLVGRRRVNDLTFSIYNVYSRMNPYFYYIDTQTENPDGSGNITGFEARQVSLFPIIPSVTYNYKFTVRPLWKRRAGASIGGQ